MKKFADFIVKHRKVIFAIFIIVTIASAAMVSTVYKNVNSDLTKYLPLGTKTSDGQKFISENFGINGDCEIGITGVSKEEVAEYAKYFGEIEGVTAVMWRDADMLSMLPYLQEIFETGKIFGVTVPVEKDEVAAAEMEENIAAVRNLFYNAGEDGIEGTNDDVYLILMTLSYGASTSEAFGVLEKCDDYLSDKETTFYIGGMTQMTREVFESTIYEVWKYTLLGVIVVLVLLALFTSSWVEPIILLLTLGISIIINMGTNIILPSTSIITFSASAILQLGLAMDYAVFFLHALKEERKHTVDFNEAVANSIPKTFKTVIASALTTVGGFIALFFMRFSIGQDMGGVLAKGILMALLTVVFFEPVLAIAFKNKFDKWKHKSLNLHFRKPIKLSVKYRTVVVISMLALLLPAMLLQEGLNYGYLDFVKTTPPEGKVYEMVETGSNQLVISVPFKYTVEKVDKKDVYVFDDYERQYEFVEELKKLTNNDGSDTVSFVLGITSIMPKAAFSNDFLLNMMMTQTTGEDHNGDGQDDLLVSSYLNNGFALYTVGITTDVEGEDTFATLNKIENLVKEYFGADSGYQMVGMSQAAKDFAEITPTDFTRVSIASILIIFVILLLTFKSFKHSILLVLLIQFGIWLNLALQRVIGTQINFMSYIIISSIQLGSTVDYAILITTKYRENRKKMMPSQAAYLATSSSVMSVLTSASIMAGACFSVYIISTNLIVAEMTMLIARGSIISALLVLFVLPAILAYMDRPMPDLNTWRIAQNDKLRSRRALKEHNANEQATAESQKPKTASQIAKQEKRQKLQGKFKELFKKDKYLKGDDSDDTL